MTRCSLGKFPLLSQGASTYAKTPEILTAKDGTVILHKWQLSRHLGICFWISESVLVQTIVFRVWMLDLLPISAMYALGSWLGPSDEIRLYANNMQRIYTEYKTKTRIETTKATGICSFVFISYMCWIWARNVWRYKWRNTFNGILSKSSLFKR